MTSTSISAEFQTAFAGLKSDVEAAIASNAPADAARTLLSLRQALIDAHGQIPPYDQKRYERDIRSLEERMDASRASRPKARFAFKRTPTPRSSTPVSVASAASGGGAEAGTGAGAGAQAEASGPAASGPSGVSGASASGTGKGQARDDGYALSCRADTRLVAADIAPLLAAGSGATGATVTLSELSRCVVDLRGAPLRSVHLDRLARCVVLLPAGDGGGVGVLAHRLTHCALVLPACAQLRLHDSDAVLLALRVHSFPVIEGCTRIRTMPCPPELTGLAELADGLADGAADAAGRWDQVQDFDAPTGASGNWRALSREEQAQAARALAASLAAGTVDPALAAIP